MKKVGLARRFLREIGLLEKQPDKLRLEADVKSLQAWIDRKGPAARDTSWREVCVRNLSSASTAIACDDVASGYEFLHIAERETAFGMTAAEMDVKARSLCAEAASPGKFGTSWRTRAIVDLLAVETDASPGAVGSGTSCGGTGRAYKCRDNLTCEALAEAIAHRNTLDRNGRRKADKLRWQLAWFGAIVLSLVATAFVYVIVHPINKDKLAEENLLAYSIYLGLLGGLVSSAITVRTSNPAARVPEIEVNFYAALARGCLGAATSIPVYIIAMSGMATIGPSDGARTWGVLLLCFAAGFSERWFLGAVGKVMPDDKGSVKSG